jgi:hypothetical protein
MSSSNQTHDHQVIRRWAEQRKGIPCRMTGAEANGGEGILKIHFSEHGKQEDLEEITWADFFNDFEKEELDFLYKDRNANGQLSNFYQLVARFGSGEQVSAPNGMELG